MTEREKMLAGQWYQPWDAELDRMRQQAKLLLWELNNLRPDQLEQRGQILQKLLGAFGEESYIEPPMRVDYGCNLYLGKGVYANYNLTVLDCAAVTIGDRTLLGPGVGIYTVDHPLDPEQRAAGVEKAMPVVIEEDVWIGGGAIILGGVTIGRGSVIGAGSVVTRDIPPGVLAVGNPCRVLREITERDRVSLERSSL